MTWSEKRFNVFTTLSEINMAEASFEEGLCCASKIIKSLKAKFTN
jgi:hypothetical protein